MIIEYLLLEIIHLRGLLKLSVLFPCTFQLYVYRKCDSIERFLFSSFFFFVAASVGLNLQICILSNCLK